MLLQMMVGGSQDIATKALVGSVESTGHFFIMRDMSMVIRLELIFFLVALTSVAVLASGDNIQENIRDHASMNIDAFIVSESNKEVLYWIRLGNTGDIVLRNITLIDIPPKGLKYKDDSTLDQPLNDRSPAGSFIEYVEALPQAGNWTDNVTWKLGDLQTSQEKLISLSFEKNSSYKDNARQNTAKVRYEALNVTLENRTDKSIWSNHFKTSVDQGPQLCDPESKTNSDCIPQSPSIQVDGLLNVPKRQWAANYIVDVKNTGLVTLNNVILEVSLEGDIKFEKAVPSQMDLSDRYDGRKFYWNIGSLSPGEVSSVLIVVDTKGQPKMDELNKTTFLGYSRKDDDLVVSVMKKPRIS
jgi:uncharacterized repeat protein (TIGR01451 family)